MNLPKSLHLPSGVKRLPTNWGWSRLDEVCVGVYDCPHSTPKITDSGPLMVRSQDIRSGVFRVEQAAHVSDDTFTERTRKACPTVGDLLYSREGTYFGIAAEVPKGVQVCLGQRMVLIRPDRKRINYRYLRYWLNSPVLGEHITGFRDGSVAERLNLPTIRALAVLVPPIEQQEAIGRILGSLDDKIELNRRMNETLEAMARAVFRSWFVDFDPVRAKVDGRKPVGMDAATTALFPSHFDHSESAAIPAGWSISTVGDEFDLTMGQSPPGETYNETGQGIAFFQGRADFGFRYPEPRVYCTAPTRFANPGDTLVSVRAPVGDVNMADRRSCIGRGVAAIRHRSGSRSLTYYMMHDLAEDFARFEAEGTVFGSINKTDFAALKVLHPSHEVVAAFERVVGPLDQRIENNDAESRTLATVRDALLPKLLSGERRLPNAERQVAGAVS